MIDEEDDGVDPEIQDVIDEAKDARRRYKPEWDEKQKQRYNAERALKKGNKREFLEALRRAGIMDGTEKFLRASEVFDRLHKR